MPDIKFKIVTPERTALQENVGSVTCPTTEGEITVLPKHVPLISVLRSGELVVKIGERTEYFAVSGGFIEVRPGSEVVVLADTVEHAREIDVERAEEARKRAEESMKEKSKKLSIQEYAMLEATLQKNLIRLKVAKRHEHMAKHRVGSTGVFKE